MEVDVLFYRPTGRPRRGRRRRRTRFAAAYRWRRRQHHFRYHLHHHHGGTAATSDSAGERPRVLFTMAVPTASIVEEHAEEEELDVDREIEDDRAKKLEHIKSLVVEFHGGNNLGAVESWLSELDVGWVLHLAGGTSTDDESAARILVSKQFQLFAESWILALHEISKTISTCKYGSCSQQEPVPPAPEQFARLVEAAVLKMLPFVGIAAANATADLPRTTVSHEKLQVLIDLHDTLSMASEHILPLLYLLRFSPNAQPTDGTTTRDLLSAELTKLDKAIWDTTVEITKRRRMDVGGVDPSGIHEATRCVTSYAKVVWVNHRIVNRILDDAVHRGEHVCFENENVSYLTNLIIDMVRSMEEQLASNSQSWFLDQSHMFLFLINNSHFMFQELQHLWSVISFPIPALTRKIDDYIDSYLQVSWAPVLKCLHGRAVLCCFTRCSLLTKFEAKFQNTYAAQKLCKVPDPRMRKRLRRAIIERVVPAFSQFLEDNSIHTPGVVTPSKVEEMLGELFEG